MFTPPDRLTSCLLLLGSLDQGSNSAVKQNVITKLEKKVERYCEAGSFGSNYLPFTFNGARQLLNAMLNSQDDYGSYASLTNNDDCAQKYADALSSNLLFRVSSALLFLVFQTDSAYSGIQGNKWKDHQLSSTSVNPGKWLTSQDSGLIDRGFSQEELKSGQQGHGIAAFIKHLVKLEGGTHTAYLLQVLLTLLFLGSWHHSKLGHACLFLDRLFQEVQSDKFQDKFLEVIPGGDYEKFKAACKELNDRLAPLVSGFETQIKPVCRQNTSLYTQVWLAGNMDENHFKACLTWLRRNIYDIQRSLEIMATDCSKWDENALQSGTSAGPFKYGFVPKKGAGTNWMNDAKGKLEGAITKLTGSQSFKCLLVTLFQPSNLKHCLQLLGSLNSNSDVKTSVIDALKGTVETYCHKEGDYLKSNFNTNLTNTFQKSDDLLKKILQGSDSDLYGPYNNTLQTGWAECIAKALCRTLPQVYSALYFLYFMTSNELSSSIKGGAWQSEQVDGSDQKNLNKWLKGEIGKDSGLITRGFKNEADQKNLKDTQGSTLAGDLSQLVKHDSAQALQNALAGMLFICHWDPSMTGHFCVFLQTFCDKVQNAEALKPQFKKTYTEEKWSKFQNTCKNLKSDLEKFVGNSAVLSAVCQTNNDQLYSNFWNSGKMEAAQFGHCLVWLRLNIELLITSLKKMRTECQSVQWNENDLKQAKTAGPFRYGFVFVNTQCNKIILSEKTFPIRSLTAYLHALFNILSPPS